MGGRNFTVTTEPLGEIKSGSDYEFALIVDKLVIYNSNIAETSVQTTRNSSLLGGKEVNPMFIYQTETLAMPKFPVSIDRSGEIVLERRYNGVNKGNLESALEDIKVKLGLEGQAKKAKVVLWYSYALSGNLGLKAQLPIAYYPDISLGFAGMADDVIEWYSMMNPSPKDAALTFDITVYTNTDSAAMRSILHINMLTVRFTLE